MKPLKVKNKKLNKALKKMSIWPGVTLFFVLIGFSLMVILAFISIFVYYLEEEKVNRLKDETQYVARLLDREIKKEDMDITKNLDDVSVFFKEDNEICITDKQTNVIRVTGNSRPDFGMFDSCTDHYDHTIYADNEHDREYWDEYGLNMPITDLIMKHVYVGSIHEIGGEEWREEELLNITAWSQVPVELNDMNVYYKGHLVVKRNDIIYVTKISALSFIVLMIPITLLFLNTLSVIKAQRRLRYLVYLDMTTGGNNWMYFIDRCKFLLKKTRNAPHAYVMVNLHMDKYLEYCTCYGNAEGEELLEKISNYLSVRILNKVETYARNEKGDFGLLIRCTSKEEARKHIQKLLAEMVGIMKNRTISFHVGAYIIPAVLTNQGLRDRRALDIHECFQYASAARKSLGVSDKEYIAFCSDELLREQIWKHQVATNMQFALNNGEFEVYLQPKYNPMTKRLEGAEALARWNNPGKRIVLPTHFIPIFEENGFITKLDDYMISQVSKLLAEWKLQGKKLIPISVNLSSALLAIPNLAEHICKLVDEYGTNHQYIELEITENAFFGDKKSLCQTVHDLKMYGFPISMDDFGSGYSSLNSLKDLPIDVLKLDMEFFREDTMEKRSEIVIKEIIQLAKNLNMKVVAEGIEREEQVDFLSEQGCDLIQGFYFAKPMKIDAFEKVVESSIE